jgi:hypothetical protein
VEGLRGSPSRTCPSSRRHPASCRVSCVRRRFRNLKILVTVKLVPDTNADKRIDPGTKRLVRTGVETVLNPFDEYAIEAALQLK